MKTPETTFIGSLGIYYAFVEQGHISKVIVYYVPLRCPSPADAPCAMRALACYIEHLLQQQQQADDQGIARGHSADLLPALYLP